MGGVSKLVSCVLQERFISFSWVKDVSWLWHGRITIVSWFLREHFNGVLAVFNWFKGCFYCAFFDILLLFISVSCFRALQNPYVLYFLLSLGIVGFMSL